MTKLYEWDKLTNSLLLSEIRKEWSDLLKDTTKKEEDYHQFISKNPYFFFSDESYLIISKLKLGADYTTDFVIVKEGYSDGLIYELVEIETPHTKLFTSDGTPSKKLNASLQQIRDWKRYLIDNKSECKRLFPTTSTKIVASSSRIKFKIIIGQRSNDALDIDKRNQIAEDHNIEIISFDRLSDLLNWRAYFPKYARIYSTQFENLPELQKNELANPFYKSISDAKWREMRRKEPKHFYYNNIEDILKVREINDENFLKFKEILLK